MLYVLHGRYVLYVYMIHAYIICMIRTLVPDTIISYIAYSRSAYEVVLDLLFCMYVSLNGLVGAVRLHVARVVHDLRRISRRSSRLGWC